MSQWQNVIQQTFSTVHSIGLVYSTMLSNAPNKHTDAIQDAIKKKNTLDTFAGVLLNAVPMLTCTCSITLLFFLLLREVHQKLNGHLYTVTSGDSIIDYNGIYLVLIGPNAHIQCRQVSTVLKRQWL